MKIEIIDIPDDVAHRMVDEAIIGDDNYFNIKELLKVKFQISDRLLIKLKKNKKILLNGSPTFVDYNLKPFDTVEIIIDFEENWPD